jgi:hypothetical protein
MPRDARGGNARSVIGPGHRRTVTGMNDTKVRSNLYLVLAGLGLVGTGYFNAQWFNGDFEHSVKGFLEAAFANSASSSFGMRNTWIYVVLSSVIAFAFAFPLFLWARERHLASTAPPI